MTLPLSIPQLTAAYAAGISPVEVVQDCLHRIAEHNDTINAMIFVDADGALDAARSADADRRSGKPAGPLHGIPIAVKDVIDVAGWPTTAGSRLFSNRIATEDAACVGRLKAAGAIIIGKTNLHELTVGPHANAWYGKVANPLDRSRGTGGTSSGSAAAVAAGFCVAALGSDTGGSNRSVAATTGLFGFKPTNGLVDPQGSLPTAESLDSIGPIASLLEDVMILMSVIASGFRSSGRAACQIDQITLAFCPSLYASAVDPTLERAFEDWSARLRRAGVTLVERQFDHQPAFVDAGLKILMAEFAAFYGSMIDRSPERVSASVLDFLGQARAITPADLAQARKARAAAKLQMAEIMEGVDVLAIPTTPGLAPRLSDELTRVGDTHVPFGTAGGRFRRWANMLDMPSLAVPIRTEEALPASLQLAALPHRDEALLRMAAILIHQGLAH